LVKVTGFCRQVAQILTTNSLPELPIAGIYAGIYHFLEWLFSR
jgi:hypothetical protein